MSENKINSKVLHNISYGLYVVTCNDNVKDNGLIVNTVTQVASNPLKIAVAISKQNYSHDVIKETKKMNVNALTTETPFSVFEKFGFQSGRDVNKFENTNVSRLGISLQYSIILPILYSKYKAFLFLMHIANIGST